MPIKSLSVRALVALFLAVATASGLSLAHTRNAAALTNCNVADLAIDGEEQGFLDLINAYRAQNSAGALTMSVNLNRAASWMAMDMATKNYFSHTDSLGRTFDVRISNCGGVPSAENIAAGVQTAQDAFNTWR